MIIPTLLSLLFAVSVGMIAAFLFMGLFYSSLSTRLIKKLKLPEKPKKKEQSLMQNPRTGFACIIGALGFGLLAWDTPYFFLFALIGGFLALGVMLGARYVKKSSERFMRLREVAILHESIDLFCQAGFTVRQAMQMSLPLVEKLRPALENCIFRWGNGPMRAIEQFGYDIDLSEADVLIAILMHIEEVGTDKVAGVIAEESSRIDELRETLAEMRVAGKPIYSAAYIVMPVGTLLGIIMGPIAYRAIQMISNMKAPM